MSRFEPPFMYEYTRIYDGSGYPVIDIRGWGYLTVKGHGALGLDEAEAIKIQDEFGEKVARILNAHWEDEG